MEIEIIQPIGFCSGVDNAIKKAIKIKNENPNNRIIVLGNLVHNEFVIKHLKSLNIISLSNNSDIESLNSNDIVIFTAHGHDKKIEEKLTNKNIKFFDCVCPKVKENLELITKKIQSNYEVIFIGYENHPETISSVSISKNVHLFDIEKGFIDHFQTSKPIFVTNQTTLNFKDLDKIFKVVKRKFPNAIFNNEICGATRIRQENILKIGPNVDCVFIVGDKNSSNTRRLYEMSLNENKKAATYLVSSDAEISKELIEDKQHIVISSGTSAPIEIIHSIVNKIKELSK